MPDPDFHPEIDSIKSLVRKIYENERRKLWIFCDLHGHSKKKNCFFYGCNTAANGGFLSWTIVRLLPRIFAKKTHLFSYKDCRFKVEPYKLGTGRVVAWKQFMITHSFTLESSFYGYDFGEDSHKWFTEKEYHEVGSTLCLSIFDLHFLWKSIRNELKLTNGWLKPRKLLEMTGVPAAQLLNEELQKKKKED
jgi:cytosolic carboxypeptidase protein 2/3